MQSVKPDDLMVHRVFFTEFDRFASPPVWSTDAERAAVARALERKLKLLLLTKAHVVIATSQLLESPLAHDLLRKHPDLLSSRAVIPSMRTEFTSSLDFLEFKRREPGATERSPYQSHEARETATLLDESAATVRWSLGDMSDWFRDRLSRDIEDDQSLLRLAARDRGLIIPPTLAQQIRAEQGLSRNTVDRLSADAGEDVRDLMKLYGDFVYYLSGARTTNSEGVLPQENLLDFALSDLVGRKTRLSEFEVFFKIFIDMVKAKTSTIFPTDFLDAITIDDALELRQIAISKQFTDKYNVIQRRTKEALDLHDPERLILLLRELDMFETELHEEFEAALNRELPTRIREEKMRATGKVVHSVASLLIPFYSPESYKEILVSGLNLLGRREAATEVDTKISQGVRACESALESMHVLDRQVLLDFVDELKRRYTAKL